MKKLLFFFFICHLPFLHAQNVNLTLAGQLSYGTQHTSNIWGWKHPVTGKEYALVGAANGLSIVDVTNPSAPTQIVEVPAPDSASMNCIWREVKTWGNFAYVTTECGSVGLQIIDLINLPSTNLPTTTWTPKFGTDTLKTIHALHIEKGKLYLYGYGWQKGVLVADVSTTPMIPVFLANYDAGGYIHDGYVQGDTMYAAHIWAGTVEIADMSNPATPVTLATFTTPNAFTHNTWLASDNKTLFTTDETANSYLAAFDISNLNNIAETDRIQTSPGSNAFVHNTYVVQKNNTDYAVSSWYSEGFTIVDATRKGNLVQVGNYDTSPFTGADGEKGCWGVYPYLPSGNIIASDIEQGLFVLTPNYVRACYLEGKVTDCNSGNPVLGVTVKFKIVNPSSSSYIDVTDAQGDYAIGIDASGTYQVIFSKTGFTTDTDTVVMSAGVVNTHNFQLCPLGIHESSLHTHVNVFPNPFKESATLEIKDYVIKNSEFKMFDVFGRVVNSFDIHDSKFNIERGSLSSGVYFYQIINEGDIIAHGKFCVE